VQFTQFGVHGHDKSDPYVYGMYAAIVYVQSMFNLRISSEMRGCNYTIRAKRARWIGPYAYGMYAAIVYVQSMFIPRTYDIYPRTTTFTPTCIHCREPIYRARK